MSKLPLAKIIATGSYLPEKIITNDELPEILNTNDEWIFTRTGIKQRHIAAEDEFTSDLGVSALKQALERSGYSALDLDAIIVATTTPDYVFPSTATIIQGKIGAKNAFAFDVQAVCAGFVYALSIANNIIKTKQAKRVAVIGCETMSRILDWNDRSTCILFGDGAGCFILEENQETEQGIIDVNVYSDGSFTDILKTKSGASRSALLTDYTISMNGREVYKHAVEKMSDSINKLMLAHNLKIDDIDVVIPHQANSRIIKAVGERIGLDEKKTINIVQHHANTSAASIPLAFDYAISNSLVKTGDKIISTALGGGLTWGSAYWIY